MSMDRDARPRARRPIARAARLLTMAAAIGAAGAYATSSNALALGAAAPAPAPALAPAAQAQTPSPASAKSSGTVTTPESFFGFQLGADRKMARWDRMVEYYKQLERESQKIKVVDMGPSTMGHPFLLVIISSPQNLAKLEQLRQINAKISDPRGTTETEIKKLIGEGRAASCSR